MPIKWSALKVSEAMDMAAEFVNQAAEPLEQAKIVAIEARQIDNVPQYVDERLRPLCGSHISPRRPKSASATSPGSVSAMRTVVCELLPSQPFLRTKRRRDM